MTEPLPTGPQLIDALWSAARSSGVDLIEFVAPLAKDRRKFLRQLRRAQAPTPLTIARVTALIEGAAIPSPYCVPKRIGFTDGIPMREIGERRAIAEAAFVTRRPGETMHDAVKRIERELNNQERVAA